MAYRSAVLILDAREDAARFDDLVALAASLGAETGTAVVASEVIPPGHGVPVGPGTLMLRAREAEDALLAMRETLVPGVRGVRLDWRSRVVADPTGFVLDQAARGDLVIVSRPGRKPQADLDLARLILSAGRPVLVLPRAWTAAPVRRVALAYRNTREGRIAVAAALPVLRLADQALIIGMGKAAPATDLEDVTAQLCDHGVFAEIRHLDGPATAMGLTRAAQHLDAQILVSGAYGHGEARERIFGGVTRDLIADCALPWLTLH